MFDSVVKSLSLAFPLHEKYADDFVKNKSFLQNHGWMRGEANRRSWVLQEAHHHV